MDDEEIRERIEAEERRFADEMAKAPSPSDQLDVVREAVERRVGQPCIARWGDDRRTIMVQWPVIDYAQLDAG